jgi:hypothetical protein
MDSNWKRCATPPKRANCKAARTACVEDEWDVLERHSRTLVHRADLSLVPGTDDAEAVPLGIGEDDVVRIRRSLVPVNLGSAQSKQALDLSRLVLGVEGEVEARRDLQARANTVERKMRSDLVGRAEQNEVVARSVVSTNVAERRLRELSLTAKIVDAQNDRADTEHRCRS